MSDITANVVVTNPRPIFTDSRSFKALPNGRVYIGLIDTDPTIPTNQIPVYIENEDGSHVQIAQPLVINAAGKIVYNGQLVKVVTVKGHSMAVYDAYGSRVDYIPNVLKYDPDQFRQELASFAPPGTDLIGTVSGVNLTEYLGRVFIFIDDLPGVDPTGAIDSSAAINAAISNYSGTGVRFIGNLSSKYRLEDTIDFRGLSNIELDFNHATVIDNVQGFIPENANRGKHTFLVYDTDNIRIRNITYDVESTRANTAEVPTCVFWVGGQYLGTELTLNTELSGFRTVTGKAPAGGMVIAGMGEQDTLRVSDFFIDGGSWGFGCNFEYGERPVDLTTDFTMGNGKHPYNIKIEGFSGQNLLTCQGFLRTASCYNVHFDNCIGYNVRNFFYGYGGDRNISRFSQNVLVTNCKSKVHPGILATAFYAFTVIIVNKDGSTGEALPAWTNYDHMFVFENCEIMHNQVQASSCVRVAGTKGSANFRNCIFERAYYGAWCGPSANPDYIMDSSVHFENCVFKNNIQDFHSENTRGTLLTKCQMKLQSSGSASNPAQLISSPRTKFRDCYFATPSGDRPSITIDSASGDCHINGTHFELFNTSAGYAVAAGARVHGTGNTTNGTAQVSLTQSSTASYGIRGEPSTMIRDAVLFNSAGMLNADVGNFYTSANTTTLNGITGGIAGDEVVLRGTAVGSAVTFNNVASGVAISERLVMKGGVSRIESGANWSVRFKKVPGGGWYEI